LKTHDELIEDLA
jgi:hypothetical protein